MNGPKRGDRFIYMGEGTGHGRRLVVVGNFPATETFRAAVNGTIIEFSWSLLLDCYPDNSDVPSNDLNSKLR
jgi:hypothetical protein